MIKKAVLLTAVLFFLYFIFLSFLAPTWWKGYGNKPQFGAITVENYLYHTIISNKNVILGTSLSERIKSDSIKNTYNLSLSGLSVFDGLYILKLKKEVPKCIFIEMNLINLMSNPRFKSHFSNPALTIKKHIVSFQEERQPLVILGNLINRQVVAFHQKSRNNLNVSDSNKIKIRIAKLVEMQKRKFSRAPSDSLLALRINQLAKELEQYEKKGMKIVFIEVPIYTGHKDLPFCNAIRNAFYTKFPKSNYAYIDVPENFKVKTTDGLHLTPEEAKSYSSYLRKKIELLHL